MLDPFGRYGGLNVDDRPTTKVRCRHIDGILKDALAHADTISLLKMDVEGFEEKLVHGARPDLLARVEADLRGGSRRAHPAA